MECDDWRYTTGPCGQGLDDPAIRVLVAHVQNLTLTGARGITPIMRLPHGSVDADTRGSSHPKTQPSDPGIHRSAG